MAHPSTWTNRASCAGNPHFADQPHPAIVATCNRCPAIADCAEFGQGELVTAWKQSDPGDGRVYAGHQMAELVAIGHTSKSQAIAILDMAGSLTKERSAT